jgi:hypothetical protein
VSASAMRVSDSPDSRPLGSSVVPQGDVWLRPNGNNRVDCRPSPISWRIAPIPATASERNDCAISGPMQARTVALPAQPGGEIARKTSLKIPNCT